MSKSKSKSKAVWVATAYGAASSISREDYDAHLHILQVELVKLQRHVIRQGQQILIVLEGRDGAGKDGSIKRIMEYLSPRDTRVVALGAPSAQERSEWYFQRYVAQLPRCGEMVLFNRSWYNRAGVEKVMKFCTKTEYNVFMRTVPGFEQMLVQSGVLLLKFYLDIDRAEQINRLAQRSADPLKQWKQSPVDAVAVKHWRAYSDARNAMLIKTSTPSAPWMVVRANDKMQARLNLIRCILSQLHYAGAKAGLPLPDPLVVFPFTPECVATGGLYP